MANSFHKNRAFFEARPLSSAAHSQKFDFGGLCLTAMRYVITCHAADEPHLADSMLRDAEEVIARSKTLTANNSALDEVKPHRVYVLLAERVAKLLREECIDRTATIPYEAFETYLSSPTDIEPEDFDCVWLMWGLFAALENRRDKYEELLPKLKRKPHRELVRERELLKRVGLLFAGTADEEFWELYRAVLLRWLDPVLQTEGEAFLYRDAIRYLLVLNWMVYKLGIERREDFLEVVCGNV
jgi:hypothetical protein